MTGRPISAPGRPSTGRAVRNFRTGAPFFLPRCCRVSVRPYFPRVSRPKTVDASQFSVAQTPASVKSEWYLTSGGEGSARQTSCDSNPPVAVWRSHNRVFVGRPRSGAERSGGENRKITRVIVFGGSKIHAVRVSVDPKSPRLFTVEPLIVKDNLAD